MGRFQPLSAIQDRTIVDPSGERVGYIHDVLFDLNEGRIEYVCIAVSADSCASACEVVVPWSAIRSGTDNNDSQWAVAATKRVLYGMAQPITQRR